MCFETQAEYLIKLNKQDLGQVLNHDWYFLEGSLYLLIVEKKLCMMNHLTWNKDAFNHDLDI